MKPDFGLNFDHSYARLPKVLFSMVKPEQVPSPEIVLFNDELAEFLGLNSHELNSQAGAEALTGVSLPIESKPLAQAYAGHQFGHFTMLGDGRAVLLGEQITPTGKRYDLQLKGSGRTPYSRGGDGKAALGPMLREYIISEAMHSLNIPTTRSLAVITTGETVRREEKLPGAILVRVAASHLRVGTFQYASRWGTNDDLKALADYALERHFPEVSDLENRYQLLLGKVIHLQAELVAKWMLVGFIHGVMNTDNVTISGETIDYGPCAFMDRFDPATVFSSIDHQGRYAYANQPKIAQWNLARFAEAMLPLLANDEAEAVKLAEAELKKFSQQYERYYLDGMRSKLGLSEPDPKDKELVRDLLLLMHEHKADYTNTFLDLTFEAQSQKGLANSERFALWKESWQQRVAHQPGGWQNAQALMKRNNPAVIPRNHRVEEALKAAVQDGNYVPLQKLMQVLKNPFAHSREQAEYAQPPEPSNIPYRTFCGT